MNDPIADMIIRIKNAGATRKASVVIPYSKLKFSIADLLQREGFIKSYSKKGKKVNKFIEIDLLYKDDNKTSKINGVKRLSKLSKRVYCGAKDLRPVKSGYGLTVVSTPEGIVTDREARKRNVGGELLFKIW